MAKLGEPVPTKHVTLKATKQKIKINVADFDPKLHAEIDEQPAAEPKAKPKAKEATAAPKPK